ncbi:hypothetical protein TNCV_2515961 [Trichonephila clavipes]|nr:hypothetical protein TNCV_2515961 [Trichonephila clavipes]
MQETLQFSSVPPQSCRKRTWRRVRGLPSLIPCHQPHEMTRGSTAVLSIALPRRHYAFTNIHVFTGIRTQALRYSSQRREPLHWMGDMSGIWNL